MKKFISWLGQTLFHQQRKLFVTGCTGGCLLAGYLYAANHAGAIDAYRVFAEWSVFLAGLYMAGNSSVALWQARFGGTATPPKDKP